MSESKNKKYRILSLEGGGFRGVISAVILKEVENAIVASGKGQGLNDYFDLIAGTSTGSLLAAGIALGMTAEELLSVYEKDGEKIFPNDIRKKREARIFGIPWTQPLRSLRKNLYPLYPQERGQDEGIFQVLQKHLSKPSHLSRVKGNLREDYLQRLQNNSPDTVKAITLKDIKKPSLLIPSYNTDTRFLEWFVNYQDINDEFFTYKDVPLWKLCACSAAAPTFFEPVLVEFSKDWQTAYIDGGVAANNPGLVSIARAMRIEPELKIQDISVLSIGTGRVIYDLPYKGIRNWSPIDWAKQLGNLFLPAPNKVTDEICWQLIRGNDEEVKVNRNRYLSLNVDINLDREKIEKFFIKSAPKSDSSLSKLKTLARILAIPNFEQWTVKSFKDQNFWEETKKNFRENLPTSKSDEELSEIDNPDLFLDLNLMTINYLEHGKTHEKLPDKIYWEEFKNPKQAIKNFIHSN